MWPHKITTNAIMNIKVLRNLFFTFVLMNINIVHFINGSSLDSPHLGFNKRGEFHLIVKSFKNMLIVHWILFKIRPVLKKKKILQFCGKKMYNRAHKIH